MSTSNDKTGLPRWWTSGVGPLAIGVTASLAAAIMVAIRWPAAPPDGFGTLVVIALVANIAAIDNASDEQGRRDNYRTGVAIGSIILTVASVVALFFR